jgi:hypothetical protein
LEPVPPVDRAPPASSRGWSRPFFTAPLRAGTAEPPDPARWEEVLRHEESLAFALTGLLGRLPGIGRLIGPPPGRPASLAEHEAAVARVRATPLYRRLEALRRGRAYRRLWKRHQPPAPPDPRGPNPDGDAPPASLGPLTSRRVDEAIELLRTIPFEELQRRGWHVQPAHFYWPLNDVAFLRAHPELWHDRGLPRGVRWEVERQLELLRELNGYRAELADVPRLPRPGRVEFVWENNAFGGADAVVYYGLVRRLRPGRVVEVGAGWSSLLLARALERNAVPTEVALIEPHPDERLFAALPTEWQVHRTILQEADLGVFTGLRAGDVCLFDGSHCVRTASDVNWLFFEVLPRLARGVFVLVHDILLPEDYLDRWILDEGLSWNEQYLVQAFLMHNDAYAVRMANHLLWTERRREVEALHGADGTALVLEKVADPEP